MAGLIQLEVDEELNITFQVHNRVLNLELVMVEELALGVLAGVVEVTVAGIVVIVVAEAITESINVTG